MPQDTQSTQANVCRTECRDPGLGNCRDDERVRCCKLRNLTGNLDTKFEDTVSRVQASVSLGFDDNDHGQKRGRQRGRDLSGLGLLSHRKRIKAVVKKKG